MVMHIRHILLNHDQLKRGDFLENYSARSDDVTSMWTRYSRECYIHVDGLPL